MQNIKKMNLPLVTIWCPTYNHASYIRQTLDGFIMQKTTFSIEILIHDDASTDGTAAIIREYESKYPNIMNPIYQTENQYSKGTGETYFSRAKGKYIALCDGDDYWTDPNKLQKQVDFLEAHEEYVLTAHANDVIKEGKIVEEWNRGSGDFLLDDSLLGPPAHTATWVFRKSSLRLSQLEAKGLIIDDTLMCHLLESGKGYYMDEVMSVYRLHSGGIWSPLNEFHKNFYTYIFRLYIWRYYPSKRKLIRKPLMQEGLTVFLTKKSNRLKNNPYYVYYKKYSSVSTEIIYYYYVLIYLWNNTFLKRLLHKVKRKFKEYVKTNDGI